MKKLITFTVPCYNSAEYMDHCIETLITAGEEAQIILVDDGSFKDDTPQKCDEWAARYPSIITAVHQENGGHGEGVNQGIRHAEGLYYKVVDSDDWLDTDSLKQVMGKLREFSNMEVPVDMVVANYVYEHVEDNTHKVMNYRNVFPVDRVITWEDTRPFLLQQYLLMHSVIYRTELLHKYHVDLPKHTFYVDNIYVYQMLPYIKTIYYMNVPLYRYFIGRADQSVNEEVMAKRYDQQIRITMIIVNSHDVIAIKKEHPQLGKYMMNFLSMMMTVSSIFSVIADTPESLQMRKELWDELKRKDPRLYRSCRRRITNMATNLPSSSGRKTSVKLYRLAQKIFKFN